MFEVGTRTSLQDSLMIDPARLPCGGFPRVTTFRRWILGWRSPILHSVRSTAHRGIDRLSREICALGFLDAGLRSVYSCDARPRDRVHEVS